MKRQPQKRKTTSAKAPKKAWTVAVYMAGYNNLDPNALLDLNEMKRVGSSAEINIVAQLDTANVDLRDFCERLDVAASLSTAVKSAAHDVGDALDKYVIKNGHLGAKVANAKGVSIYFPQDEISPLYTKHLDFAKKTPWTKFLKAFLS